MQDQNRINELRKILFKEIRGELSFNEKREFLQECVDEKVIMNLHEKYLRRRKIVSLVIILYSIFLTFLLLLFLVMAESPVIAILITIAIILIPFLVWTIFTKTLLGYEKFDLVLRIMNKFYVKKK